MSGGWKVMHAMCPKCMEDANDDDKSHKSSKSNKSSRSSSEKKAEQQQQQQQEEKPKRDAAGEFDKNGCCVLHPHIQVAKKKVLGGWKVVRTCPSCEGKDVGLDDDDFSVCSGKSERSAKSTRSNKSSSHKKGKRGEAVQSGKYGALPFDGEGYCCQHPSVRIAKKKAMGGWKVSHHDSIMTLFFVCSLCPSKQTF
jgi:hypothetical protein